MPSEGLAAVMESADLQFSAFPFTPYPIQLQFMSAVYRALQKGGVAIVESPTGLLQSLSLTPSCSHFATKRIQLRTNNGSSIWSFQPLF